MNRFETPQLAYLEIAEMIKEFIETANSDEERHIRRVNKISSYENK